MTERLIFHVERDTIPTEPVDGEIHVWLFGPSPPYAHVGSVGASVLDEASRFTVRPSVAAMDLVAIAMAVTAADTFVGRIHAPDGWSRSFQIILPLCQPDRWRSQLPTLESALKFLSGDEWSFELTAGGVPPPATSLIRRRQRTHDLATLDCVSLFSGGLDSAVGAFDLLAQGKRPLLFSHSPQGDASRQAAVSAHLPVACQRFSTNSYPTWDGFDDDSMRTRSFQFLATAVLGADTISQFRGGNEAEVFLCENGFIALNPPLTARRIGSLSTRTAHPQFLNLLGVLLDGAGIPVKIVNPYRHKTKGEMLTPYRTANGIGALVADTVSCGKWKRQNKQCGRCVPCLIRRASLHSAGIPDDTKYQVEQLSDVLAHEDNRDDLIAVQTALRRRSQRNVRAWILQSGPLPSNEPERGELFAVADRGCDELEQYLRSEGVYE